MTKTFQVGAAPGRIIFFTKGKPLFALTTESAESMLKDLPNKIALSRSLLHNLNTADPVIVTLQPTPAGHNLTARVRQFISKLFKRTGAKP